MTRERSKELFPINTALAEGKIIECRCRQHRKWEPITNPAEPLEFWGRVIRNTGQVWLFPTKEEAEKSGAPVIHLREVEE